MLNPFGVTVNGSPIGDYHIKPGPARIAYSREFEEHQACAARGMPYDVFKALPGSPDWLLPGQHLTQCHIVMTYRMHRHIESAGNEAQRRDFERKQVLSQSKNRR